MTTCARAVPAPIARRQSDVLDWRAGNNTVAIELYNEGEAIAFEAELALGSVSVRSSCLVVVGARDQRVASLRRVQFTAAPVGC